MIGNALLSNTTACEASRLLVSATDDTRWGVPTPNTLRICDLMSLIDSAVLHEQLFYLPAELPGDIHELELRNRLVESGALIPLPKGDDYNLIGQALLASLSTVEGLRHGLSGTGPPLSFEDFRPRLIDELELTTDTHPAVDDRMSWAIGRWQQDRGPYRMVRSASGAESFDQAAQELISAMEYAVSGAYEDSMASLRAMYYVFASEHYGLPYLASVSHRAVERKFPNYFQPSVRDKLYQQLAWALRANVDTVAKEFDGPIVFVPPFSALVLNRASTPAEIPSETLALRAEYDDFRRKMCELERDRLDARSLDDRLKALRRIEQLGKEVVRPFDQSSQMKLEPALRYIPDMVELGANPTNPVGWAKVLLGLPTEALASWYRRRPVAKLIRAARAVSALPGYDSLLTKHFGEGLASGALQVQSTYQLS